MQHRGLLLAPSASAVCPGLVTPADHSAQFPRLYLGLDKPTTGVLLQQSQDRTWVTAVLCARSWKGWSFPTLPFSPSCHGLCFLPPTVSTTPGPTSISSLKGNVPRGSCVPRRYFSCESTRLRKWQKYKQSFGPALSQNRTEGL